MRLKGSMKESIKETNNITWSMRIVRILNKSRKKKEETERERDLLNSEKMILTLK